MIQVTVIRLGLQKHCVCPHGVEYLEVVMQYSVCDESTLQQYQLLIKIKCTAILPSMEACCQVNLL
jgi:hypothetical protein